MCIFEYLPSFSLPVGACDVNQHGCLNLYERTCVYLPWYMAAKLGDITLAGSQGKTWETSLQQESAAQPKVRATPTLFVRFQTMLCSCSPFLGPLMLFQSWAKLRLQEQCSCFENSISTYRSVKWGNWGSVRFASPSQRGICKCLNWVNMWFIPVSYTHLTLPTIYSV